MNSQAKGLIERMQHVNAEVIQMVQACSDEQWQTAVAEEDNRSVGVVCHHIALAYEVSMQWAAAIARGESPPPMTRSELDAFNAHHAQEHARTSQADTLAYLKRVTEETAVKLQSFSDEQLGRLAPIALVGNQPFSAAWLLENFAINHASRHLEAIQAAVRVRA